MKITAEVWEGLLANTVVEAYSAAEKEKRGTPRLQVRGRLNVELLADGRRRGATAVWTRDISQGGLSFVHNRPLDKGTGFVIELPRRMGESLILLCAVANCRPCGGGLFTVGATWRVAAAGEVPSAAARRAAAAAVTADAAAAPAQPATGAAPVRRADAATAATSAASAPLSIDAEAERIRRAMFE